MGTECEGEDRIDEEIARLGEKFGDFQVIEEHSKDDKELFESSIERVESGWMGDAGAVVVDGKGRTLLIRHEGNPDQWSSPGGGHHPGETHEETAEREVREETGVEVELTNILYARKKYVRKKSDAEQSYCMLTVDFLAEYVEGEISIEDEEIIEAKWFEKLPGNCSELLINEVENVDKIDKSELC